MTPILVHEIRNFILQNQKLGEKLNISFIYSWLTIDVIVLINSGDYQCSILYSKRNRTRQFGLQKIMKG